MKNNYEFLFTNEGEPRLKPTEPFSLMRSRDILPEGHFTIWKLNSRSQNIHAHDYYQMWYILRGSCDHMIDNHQFSLKTGDIIIIPPFSYHSMHNGSDNLVVVGIDFTEKFLSGIDSANKIMMSCINPLFFKQRSNISIFFGDDEIENLILEMFNEYMKKSDFYEIVIKSNLLKLLVMFNRMSNTGGAYNDNHKYLIGETLRYIHNNLSGKIKIDDLCKITNVSASLLGTSFKNTTGKTIIEYVNSLKIDKAKQLLKETDMSITEISYDLGFSDVAYFNRVFKRTTNHSPKDYRKQHREL